MCHLRARIGCILYEYDVFNVSRAQCFARGILSKFKMVINVDCVDDVVFRHRFLIMPRIGLIDVMLSDINGLTFGLGRVNESCKYCRCKS